jgi:hypothetical protein
MINHHPKNYKRQSCTHPQTSKPEQEIIQGDQKVSVHLTITMPHYLAQSDCLAARPPGPGGH